LGVPLKRVEPEPWSLGVRLRHEPRGVCRFRVAAGSPADGARVGDLSLGDDAWVSMVVREGRLLPPNAGTVLRAGDEVLVLVDPEEEPDLQPVFSRIFAT
jgi:cell volume regulation protein A